MSVGSQTVVLGILNEKDVQIKRGTTCRSIGLLVGSVTVVVSSSIANSFCFQDR